MNTSFFIIWIGILAFDGVFMYWLTWAVHSPKFQQYRIRTPEPWQEIPKRRRVENTMLNNILSLLIFIAFFYFLGEREFYGGWPGVAHFAGEVLGVLLLYDFMYYFLHRAMHHPKLMKFVHGVHHRVRFPTSGESIYLHPGENIAGLGLLLLAVVILGPISVTSFLVIFFLHSVINIIVHSNLVFPHPALRLFNFWVVKHDVHHSQFRYNYASIFPFWDQLFGTAK